MDHPDFGGYRFGTSARAGVGRSSLAVGGVGAAGTSTGTGGAAATGQTGGWPMAADSRNCALLNSTTWFRYWLRACAKVWIATRGASVSSRFSLGFASP